VGDEAHHPVTEFRPIRDLTVELDGRTMVLIDSDGRRRFGRFDRKLACWLSTVEDGLRLRPVAAKEMPHAP
jgi:hypothetical protein